MNWDKRYADNDTPWDKGKAHPELVQLLSDNVFSDWNERKIIAPGAGRGYDVTALCVSGVNSIGIDISPLAVETAVSDNMILADFIYDKGSIWQEDVEGIWEHTCFCAIPPHMREDYVSACARILKSGGFLRGIFFLTPDMEPGESGPPFGCLQNELFNMFSQDFEILHSYIPKVTYEGREGRELFIEMRRR